MPGSLTKDLTPSPPRPHIYPKSPRRACCMYGAQLSVPFNSPRRLCSPKKQPKLPFGTSPHVVAGRRTYVVRRRTTTQDVARRRTSPTRRTSFARRRTYVAHRRTTRRTYVARRRHIVDDVRRRTDVARRHASIVRRSLQHFFFSTENHTKMVCGN